MIEATAQWQRQGGATLGKPTHFETYAMDSFDFRQQLNCGHRDPRASARAHIVAQAR